MNWIFFVIQRIVLSLLNVIQRIESFFLLNVTQRIESLLKNMKNSLIWSKERIEILWYDTKDWIFLIWLTEPNTFNITQRIEPYFLQSLKELNLLFFNWLKELNFFYLTQWIEYFLWSKEFDFFVECDLKELNLFCWMWPKELNHLFNMTSKNWTFFLQMTQRSELLIWQNMTQRFDFFWYDSKNRTLFLNVTQRIEPSSQKDSKNWFFDFFTFFYRFEPFFKHDSQNWALFEQYDSLRLNPSFQHESKKMTHLKNDSKIFFFAKCMTQNELNWSFLENMTLRIEIFERKTDSKKWTFSKIDSIDWTFCFTWPKELNLFFLYNSKDWTFSSFLNPFSTIALNDWPCFEYDSQNWTTHMTWLKVLIFFEYDSKNWIFCQYLFLFSRNHRVEPFSTWLRENEPDFQNLTQRIEPSSQKDSKNWTLKDYLIPTTKPSYDSWKWTFFCIWIKEIKLSFSNLWFKLLDLFLNRTHRIEPF